MIQNPGHLQGLRPLPTCLVTAPRQALRLGFFALLALSSLPPPPGPHFSYSDDTVMQHSYNSGSPLTKNIKISGKIPKPEYV